MDWNATHNIEWAPDHWNNAQYVDVMVVQDEINGYFLAYTQKEYQHCQDLSHPTGCPTAWRYNIRQKGFFHRDYESIAIGRVINYS